MDRRKDKTTADAVAIPAPIAVDAIGWSPRWGNPAMALAAILLAGLMLRLLLLAEYCTRDPFAVRPISDAVSYWTWAGQLAAGAAADREPFFSGPLYPYLLAPLRAAGGGLVTVYLVQTFMDIATAALLATVGHRRFGAAVGLLAAALYLLMEEPAAMALRVLPCTLEAFLVAAAYLAVIHASHTRSLVHGALASGLLGLLALAYPPAILCMPLFFAWWWWISPPGVQAIGRAAAATLGGLLAIAPATIHNYRACGEFIPVSAQAGVTFAQGNTPTSIGVYTPLPGISGQHGMQNRNVLDAYVQATGKPPSWNGANRHFFSRGLAVWRADPARAANLFLRKAYWFFTGRHQSEIYWPTMERAEGLLPRLWLFPLHTAWLVPPAVVGLLALARRPRLSVPELMLCGVPLIVVVLFFYSPRYRFPAIPVIAVLAAWAIVRGAAAARGLSLGASVGSGSSLLASRGWTAAVAGSLAVALATEPVNGAIGFDRLAGERGPFWCLVGDVERLSGNMVQASIAYEKGLAIGPPSSMAAANLGRVLLQLKRPDAAERFLRVALATRPLDVKRNVDLPDEAMLHHDLGTALAAQNRANEAIAEFEETLRHRPQPAVAVSGLSRAADVFLQAGDTDGAIAALRRAYVVAPQHKTVCMRLAWLLATASDRSPEDRVESLRIAQGLAADVAGTDLELLDTLAAAQAACGDFDAAAATVERALAHPQQQATAGILDHFRSRLERYQSGKPLGEDDVRFR